MFYKRLFAVVSVSLLLVACGGGKDPKPLSRDNGVILVVNNSTNIADLSINKLTLNVDNAGTSFEACTETKLLSDDVTTYTQDLYDNKSALDAQYCDQTRVSLTSIVKIQARLINNTYDDLPITYKGIGATVRVYDDANDDAIYDPDEIVWNSIVAQDQSNQASGLAPFDPNEEHSRVLGPGEAFPNQSYFPITYYFIGDQNYQVYNNDPDAYLLENNFVGLQWQTGDTDRTLSQCSPVALEEGETVDPVTMETLRFKRPVCQTIPLPVGTYHVIIEYSFTPAQPSVEFDITINAEST